MDPIALATIIRYHRQRIQHHGEDSVLALGWRDASSQRRRFEVIAAAADFNHARVLDIGCGHGDLFGFLATRFEGFSYLGIERVSEFVEVARQRHVGLADATEAVAGSVGNTGGAVPAGPGTEGRTTIHAEFVCADFSSTALPRADLVVASGLLGYRTADAHFAFKAIAQMYAAAARALIFNVLDAAHFPEHPLLVGRDIAQVESFCRMLAPRVDLHRGYAVDDVTFVMHASAAA